MVNYCVMSGTSLSEIIGPAITDRDIRFVFPSAVAAEAWASRIVETGSAAAVDKDRFIAWDRFKEITLSVDRKDRRASNGAARSLFCAAFLEGNAVAAKKDAPLLGEIITPAFASDWGAFVSSLARTLPALDGFFRRLDRTGIRLDDERYFADLRLVRERYAEFLERNMLFEPAWDRTAFRPSGSRWLLLLPELTGDWDEYEEELRAASEVRIVKLEELGTPFDPPSAVERTFAGFRGTLVKVSSAVEETRLVARFAEALISEAGLAPSDIAISVPSIADYEERIKLEFRLRDIPLDLRKGRPIPEHPAGRLFSAIAACTSTRWSYRALKDLLLDCAYPWKRIRDIDALMDFGQRFRCVSGYPENGREIDVWERSFDRLRDQAEELRIPLATAASFYRDLKRDIRDIVGARSFAELKRKLLMFKTNHFDADAMAAETDNVFSKALEEVAVLAETEERLSGIRLSDPYGLFLTHLKSVNYVFQAKDPGVTVYDYRVAAGIAPVVHIVMNATQNAASVRADPAPFLREDRKLSTRIFERDLSADFLHAYEISGSFVLFTAAERGFSGYAVPHRVLMEERFAPTRAGAELNAGRADPYEYELSRVTRTEGTASPVPAATVTQARGWNNARTLARGADEPAPPLDARKTPFGEAALKTRLLERLCETSVAPRVSPTDLNELGACAFSWLLRRGLGIREKETEIETVDNRELGMLYHRILERLFLRIAAEDPRFRAERLPDYARFLDEEITAALMEKRRTEGAFQESVYEMYRTRIRSALGSFLSETAPDLHGQALVGAELPLRREYPEYGVSLSGKADLAFAADSGELSILDFKTGNPPAVSTLAPDDSGLLGDYQMAAYVRLLETGRRERVAEAAFYSIENREFRPVVSEKKKPSRRGVPCPRDEFEASLASVDEAVEAAASTVTEAFFPVPPPSGRAVCRTCRVAAVCRIPFAGGMDE